MNKRSIGVTGVLTISVFAFVTLTESAFAQRMLRGYGGATVQNHKAAPPAKQAALRSVTANPDFQPAAAPGVPTGGATLKSPARTGKAAAATGKPSPHPAGAKPDPAARKAARSTSAAPGTTKVFMENVAWQAALDRAGFSPGIIDGQIGSKTHAAIKAFQAQADLPVSGNIDAVTAEALGVDAQPAVCNYTITEDDAAQVGPSPTNWLAKSKLPRLGYASLATLVAEHGHCSQRLLARLNPELDIAHLKPGDQLSLPSVESSAAPPEGARLEVDFGAKQVSVFDKSDKVVALFHCSIAKEKSKRPSGTCKVQTIVPNPKYLFDPRLWPEVKGIAQKLLIPPGPRNPVGLCWIGLSKKGYGIHGTPEPENIGKTGSHGCFRLANWDAQRLSKMVRVGTPVIFTDSAVRMAKR